MFIGSDPGDVPNDGAGENEAFLDFHIPLTLDSQPPTMTVWPEAGIGGTAQNGLAIQGTNLDPAGSVELLLNGCGVVRGQTADGGGSTLMTFSLDLRNVNNGNYKLRYTAPDGAQITMPNADFEVGQ